MADWLVHDELERHAAWRPSHPAVVFEGTTWTYRAFNRRVNQAARALRSLGLGADDVVAAHAKNHADLYTTFFACAKAGITYSPISTYHSRRDIEYICEELSPAVVCYSDDDDDIRDGSLGDILQQCSDATVVCFDGRPDDTEGDDRDHRGFDELVGEEPGSNPNWDLPDGAATRHNVIWTSGTTGHPKGAVRDHRATLHFSDPLTEKLPFDREMRRLVHNDMMFVAPYLSEGVPTVVGGGTLFVLRSFSAPALVKNLLRHDITDVHVTFTKIQLLSEYVDHVGIDLTVPRVQAALPNADVARKLNALSDELYHSYATTEVGRPAVKRVKAPFDGDIPFGKPGKSADVRIVTDGDRGTPPDDLPEPGVPGEMAIRGEITLRHYVREENQAEIVHDGWVYPGDVVALDENGDLVFKGRTDDRIRTGGINVFPAEVEAVLASHSDVKDVAVVGVPDEKWGERVCSVVVTNRTDVNAFESELGEYCKASDDIVDAVRPRQYVFRTPAEGVPTSAVDKVDRDALRGLFE